MMRIERKEVLLGAAESESTGEGVGMRHGLPWCLAVLYRSFLFCLFSPGRAWNLLFELKQCMSQLSGQACES